MSGGVSPFPFPRPIVCVTFWQESSAVCLPIIYSPSESSSADKPFLTLPTVRQGSPHPAGLGEKGRPVAVVWVMLGWSSLDSLFRNALCHPKTNQRLFLLIWETQNFFNQLHASWL